MNISFRKSGCHKTNSQGANFVFRIQVVILLMLIIPFLVGCGPKAIFTADPATGPAPLSVNFTNTSKGSDEFHWDFGDGSVSTTTVSEAPVVHEYILAGTHTVTLTVNKKENPDKTNMSTVTIVVEPGSVDHVKTVPEIVESAIGGVTTFTAQVVDAYNNPILGATFSWKLASNIGTIDNAGVFTAGTKAGAFADVVIVTALLNGTTVEASTTVVINPDPLDKVSITPARVGAGESKQLTTVAVDRYGNVVSNASFTWTTLKPAAGSISNDGVFTAGKVLGTYNDIVEAKASQGSISCSSTGQVTVIPGALAKVYIGPDEADIGMEMTQQFVAIGTDQYGNRISGLNFNWSVEQKAGTINSSGLFTAGKTPGTYPDSAKAEISSNGTTYSVKANVKVEPDRILFISDRNNEQLNFFIMDVDGNNQKSLTTRGIIIGNYAFSPDGNRFIFNLDSDNICTINVDGTWLIPILSGREAYEPDWSHDGTRIVFQSWEHNPSEIYVMDVDGGNLKRITNNSAYDDRPEWSPDGTKIVFISDRDGNDEIYVMNADGSDQKRLTNSPSMDTFPCWSPDGKEILFQSDRNGRSIYIMNADGSNVRSLTSTAYSSNCPSWSPDGSKVVFHSFKDGDKSELYIMNKDGSNMVRLTTNTASDYWPKWAPRKKGVKVTDASIAVSAANNLTTMTVQEVTALASETVVRLKTDLASGSGFLISSDGFILTNNHMVSDTKEITVYLKNGSSYSATIKGRDLVRDLALIKIEATGLKFLEIGNPIGADLGQQVLVLGYPLAGDNIAVTSGIVSTIDFDSGRNISWIQTDSAINPGNSGGPMLNLQGQVVGMVSAKLIGIAVEGVGFSISSNTINTYLPQLREGAVINNF